MWFFPSQVLLWENVFSAFSMSFSLFWSDVLFVIQEIKGGLHFTHTRVNRCFIYTNAEASRECVWKINQHIRSNSGIDENIEWTILYEDNTICVAQTKERYIKNNAVDLFTKSPHIMYTENMILECVIRMIYEMRWHNIHFREYMYSFYFIMIFSLLIWYNVHLRGSAHVCTFFTLLRFFPAHMT